MHNDRRIRVEQHVSQACGAEIAGKKYRLAARVNYQTQRVFGLYHILTHAEYDRGDWKQ
ncbi:MAG: hypothetical protein DMG39_25195 [Acidobacteria bacterium]|nr:MAG: hypothetical protein DMG39_25195 [Acidobacteriota bacterium]